MGNFVDIVSGCGESGILVEAMRAERAEQSRKHAKAIFHSINSDVEALREIRQREKALVSQLKKKNKAVVRYNKTGNPDVLRQAGIYV